jgi:TetR/AcrR family transcriptional repressor of nem operon
MAKKATRNKILEIGSRIIHQKGFNNTGIQEILNEAGVPKGSFYFYFKSKEEFGLALIDEFESLVEGHLASILQIDTLSPLGRLKSFFSFFRNFFQKENCTKGCPLGNLSQELSDVNEIIRKRLDESFNKLDSLIETCLYEAREKGEFKNDIPVPEIAAYVINSWEGALLRMKVSKDTIPLLIFERILFDTILK